MSLFRALVTFIKVVDERTRHGDGEPDELVGKDQRCNTGVESEWENEF